MVAPFQGASRIKALIVCRGFSNVGLFSNDFKRKFGISPSLYRSGARK